MKQIDEEEFLRKATLSPMFFFSPEEISTMVGEAKKYKIQINEQDITNYDRKASQLFKQKSITEDVIQNLVDDPDSFDEDSDFDEHFQSEETTSELRDKDQTKFKRMISKKIINKIVDDRLK